jgi:predicted GH43/DUF377 family glycosyl hydrolase
MTKTLANCTLILLTLVTASPHAHAGDVDISSLKITVTDRTTTPLLKADKPWEDFSLNYCQVVRTDGRWQMWYAAYDHTYQNDADSRLCYATSDDGVHWTKPELNLVEYAGSRANNILLDRGTHGACVFLDPAAPPAERYKLACVKLVAKRWVIFGGASPDGIHWKIANKPLLDHNSDTQQACFHDGHEYRLYVRLWSGPGDFRGHRLVGLAHSTTFGGFSAPQPILDADAHDPPNMQFYNSAAAKLRDDLYIMLPSAFYTGEDVVRVHAALSRDGQHFRRPSPQPLVELGPGFDSMAMYVAPGAIPADSLSPRERLGEGDSYWFYYYGSNAGHDHTKPDKLKFNGGFGRFRLTISTNP